MNYYVITLKKKHETENKIIRASLNETEYPKTFEKCMTILKVKPFFKNVL